MKFLDSNIFFSLFVENARLIPQAPCSKSAAKPTHGHAVLSTFLSLEVMCGSVQQAVNDVRN